MNNNNLSCKNPKKEKNIKECYDEIMSDNIGDQFQLLTKYFPDKMSGHKLDWQNKPSTYKVYKNIKEFKLDKNFNEPILTLKQTLENRASIREYSKEAISRQQLSFLLWASNGIQRSENNYQFRTAPSAGALYPIETYLCINNVESLQNGLYHYSVINHSLELLKEGDFRTAISYAALSQEMCYFAPVVFVWSSIFPRSKWKYNQRAYRYVYLDAGHIAENLALASTSIGLGTCQIAAIYDDVANNLFNLDGKDESVIYMSTVGYP